MSTGSTAPAASATQTDTHGDATGTPGHRPTPAWKRRGTRKPLAWWDRVKFLLLISGLFGLLLWNEYLRIEPLGHWGDAVVQIAAGQRWLVILAGLELLRQVHFVISERSVRYHRFWTEKVFGRFNRFTERRFSAWTRFRLRRVILVVFWIAVIAVVLGKMVDASPVVALFQAPALLIKALPMIAQITLLLLITIGQFAALFWFMSRGGVETYYPDDIETRFSDVWGQDHVVARVQENMMLLDRPEAIEERGGHVPSGILLWGPPGTGKTLMAEAVAGETGKPYVFVDPGAFTNMFMGVGILKVKSLFRKLRKLSLRYGGVIVFFDEADTLGSRGARASGQPQPGGAATPAPWTHDGCSGFSYLSAHTQAQLSHLSLSPDPVAAPDGRRSRFVMGGGMGGGSAGFDGTLQALLTELSGLKKPRGFVNRVIPRTLGMRPKPPPKYRMLVMMASNLPE